MQPVRPTVVVVLLVLFGGALFVSRSCQRTQVRLTKDQAVAVATRAVDFRPQQTQVRLVRQGLTAKPFWAVSLSIPLKGKPQAGFTGAKYERLAVVRVNANTGKVDQIIQQRPRGSTSRSQSSTNKSEKKGDNANGK